MFNKSKYGKVLKIILIIVITAIIGLIAVIGYRIYNSYYINTGAAEVAKQFEEAVRNANNVNIKYKEFNVIGTIEIPDIDIKYPILQENNTEALETSAVLLYSSQGLNKEGNSVIAGHNYRNGTMFSQLNKLKKSDHIYIMNTAGEKLEYKIYSIYNVKDEDNTYITRKVVDGIKEICLVTSADDGKSKLIVLAKEEQEI